jgi:superfamily II DNA/RNA helicase
MCPRGRQTMFFSATISESVANLANMSLNSPVQVTCACRAHADPDRWPYTQTEP